MARIRYEEGWIIEFPKHSNWRELREHLKDIARLRRVSLGVVVLEAITEYVTRERPRYPPSVIPLSKKKTRGKL